MLGDGGVGQISEPWVLPRLFSLAFRYIFYPSQSPHVAFPRCVDTCLIFPPLYEDTSLIL